MHETSTRSPTDRVLTPGPTVVTVPTASCPRIVPGTVSATSPFKMCRSEPQIVVASTRTMTSPSSWLTGSGTSFQVFDPGPSYTSAFMVPLLVAGSVSEQLGAAVLDPLGPKVTQEERIGGARRGKDSVRGCSSSSELDHLAM